MTPSPVHRSIEALLAEAPFLERLARSLCGNAAEADDLVAETWALALERPPRTLESPRGWLASVLRGRWASARRGAARRARRERGAARGEALPAAGADLERIEMQSLLLARVAALPEGYRRVVMLRFYEELAPAEIAERLGVSASTVRTRLARGLERLRGDLDGQAEGGRERWMSALAPLGAARLATPLPLAAAFTMKQLGSLAAVLVGLLLGGLALKAWVADGPQVLEGPTSEPGASLQLAPDSLDPSPAPASVEHAGTAVAREQAPVPAMLSRGSAIEVQVNWSDGSPAPGVTMTLAFEDPEICRQRRIERRADDRGRMRFGDLSKGSYRLSSALQSGDETIELGGGSSEPDGATVERVVFLMEAGERLAAQVIDANGRPVPGAQLWVWSYATLPCSGSVAASTDAAGALELRDVARDARIQARASGHAPSQSVRLNELQRGADGRIEATLQLGDPAAGGASLSGRVTNSEGEAAAAVAVWIGSRDPGAWGPELRFVTDAEGRFDTSRCLQAGMHVVHVLAPGHAIWSAEAVLESNADAVLDVRLERPHTLSGRVLGADGEPVANAQVALGSKPLGGVMQAGTWYRQDTPAPRSRSAEDGSFSLRGLPSGAQRIQAKGPKQRDGEVAAQLDLVAGTETVNDLILDRGRTIAGRVLDSGGIPIAGAPVVGVPAGHLGDRRVDVTDELGEFLLTSLTGDAYDVQVLAADYFSNLTKRRSVRPGARDVELVVEVDAALSASVAGRLPVELLNDPPALQLILWSVGDRIGRTVSIDPASGRFRAESLAAGPYTLVLEVAERPAYEHSGLELAPGEELDLGELLIEAPASLRLTLPESAPFGARLTLVWDGVSGAHPLELSETEATAEGLMPGRYRLVGSWDGRYIDPLEWTLGPGESLSDTLVLRERNEVWFALLGVPDPAPEFEFEVEDQSGRRMPAGFKRIKDRPDGAHVYRVELPTDSFELLAIATGEGGAVLWRAPLIVDGPVQPEAMPEFTWPAASPR